MDGVQFETTLGHYETAVAATLADLQTSQIVARIWQHDHTVWRPNADEISNRLGWLHLPQTMQPEIPRIQAFAAQIRSEGFTHVLLLGMGGSSLAPELFARVFGDQDGLQLAIVDTTDPDAILAYTTSFPLARTLFIVATKSGSTVETLSAFKYFYHQIAALSGQPGRQFVAITDPGSRLQELAARYAFRDTFLNDPNIGGRYSALSHFGLVPAALVGVDIARLLARALEAARAPEAARLGAIMGTLAQHGRDKLTLVVSPEIDAFGDWVEQLVAESTGKEGKGILPVVAERLAGPELYGDDRLFVSIYLPQSRESAAAVAALEAAGYPVVKFGLNDRYDLGGLFMIWELATAVAGHILDIQPFDQPNVELAKMLARQGVAAYEAKGELPAREELPISVENLDQFLAQSEPGDYVALQAFVPPTPETTAVLQTLRHQIRDRYRVATTVGYGPRFLHSTGQLHKGDSGNGLFIQFTSDPQTDLPIPENGGLEKGGLTFGVLKMAQALGDGRALQAADRRFIRFHLGNDVVGKLSALIK